MNFVWQFPAQVDRWVDGDTVVVHRQISAEEERHGENVRVEGINAPEMNTAAGKSALVFAAQLCPSGTDITLVHHKKEKYGRFLARVILPDGRDFSTVMLTTIDPSTGQPYAVPYMT